MEEYFRSQPKHGSISDDDDDEDYDDDDEDDNDDEDEDVSDLDSLGDLRSFSGQETKSHFTEYSMSSSVIRRNEGLTLLDDRFEKVKTRYFLYQVGFLWMEWRKKPCTQLVNRHVNMASPS